MYNHSNGMVRQTKGNRVHRVSWLLLILLGLVACDVAPNPDRTPTVQPSPTLNETQIALSWTDTPTVTASATSTASLTPTASQTSSPTNTITPTVTTTVSQTFQPTATTTPSPTTSPTSTYTHTPLPTKTHTPTPTDTDTTTPVPTNTPRPSSTHTSSPEPSLTSLPTLGPSLTRTPSQTPTASHTPNPTVTNTPTPTLSPTATWTPSPTVTFDLAGLPVGRTRTANTSTPQTGPTSDFSATPLPTAVTGDVAPPAVTRQPPILITATPQPAITLLASPRPASFATPTPFGFGGTYNRNDILIGGSEPGINSPTAFDIGPGGQLAEFRGDSQLYINESPMAVHPSGAGGFIPGRSISEIRWSPNGRYIAFAVTGNDPADFGDQRYDFGVWVYDTFTNTAHKILHEDNRKAQRLTWSPNGMVLLIQLYDVRENRTTNTFLPVEPTIWNADQWYYEHPYSDATWALDSASILVSGQQPDGTPVLGRVLLDNEQTFIPINLANPAIAYTRAAAELSNGQIALLGSASPQGPYSLYIMWSGAAPQLSFATPIAGQIVSWEWNDSHTALLIVAESSGVQRMWVIETSGAYRDMTPATGVTGPVRWR